MPGLEGGTNWFPPAYDPDLGMIFVSVNQWGMGLTAWEKKKLVYKPGDLYMGVDYQMYRMGETIGHVKAIDIARRPGVSHAQIAAAYRNAGFSLAESLDEGDHSHFAFGPPKHHGPQPQMVTVQMGEKTEWRIVYAPPSSGGGN